MESQLRSNCVVKCVEYIVEWHKRAPTTFDQRWRGWWYIILDLSWRTDECRPDIYMIRPPEIGIHALLWLSSDELWLFYFGKRNASVIICVLFGFENQINFSRLRRRRRRRRGALCFQFSFSWLLASPSFALPHWLRTNETQNMENGPKSKASLSRIRVQMILFFVDCVYVCVFSIIKNAIKRMWLEH